jgi:rhodanese-related sulfurtransferase
MKLLGLFSLALAAFGQEDVRHIPTEELKSLLNEKTFFLDVRSAAEIEQLGTLKGYVNIPFDELEKRLSEIPKDKRIITA